MKFVFSDMAKKFILLCLGIFLFLLFFHKGIETEDVWLHLSTGRWIINHIQVPHEDKFPFANERTPYVCHEWLASSLLYLVFKAVGFLGLKFFRSLFFMLSIGIFFGYAHRRLPFSILTFLTLLMSYALFQRCLLRPDSLNLLFVQLFLIILFSYEKNGGCWKLFLLPLIGVFWINLHMMGAFIYGGSIIFIFLVSALIKHGVGKKQVKELTWMFLVFLAAFIINPYGIEGLLFPYKVILFPKYYGFYKMMGITAELQNSAYVFLSFDYFYYILLTAFSFIFLLSNKKPDLTLNFLFTFALIIFLYMSRNSSFFTLIACYTIVHGAQNMGFTNRWAKARWSAWIDIIILTGVTFYLIIQSLNLFHENVYFNGAKHRALFIETNPYVTSTINLLNENGIYGPVFNCTLLGGAILWLDYPQLRPFDDGRHLDYERYNDEINVLQNPKKFWRKAERTYGFKVVILSEGFNLEKKVIQYLSFQNDWKLIAVKGPFVIYVKKKTFHLPDALDKFEQRLRSDILTDNDIHQLSQMIQRQPPTILEKFFDPSPLTVDLFSNGVTLMMLGYNGPAAKNFIEALKISDQSYMRDIAGAFLKQL